MNMEICISVYDIISDCRHSLLATRLLNAINERFSASVSVKDLFIRPTVFAMARHIDVLTNRTDSDMSDEDSRSASPPLDLIKEVERHDQAVLRSVYCLKGMMKLIWLINESIPQ